MALAKTRYLERCLHVTDVHPSGAGLLALGPALSLFHDLGREGLDLGHQFPQALGVVEQGPVALGLGGAEVRVTVLLPTFLIQVG